MRPEKVGNRRKLESADGDNFDNSACSVESSVQVDEAVRAKRDTVLNRITSGNFENCGTSTTTQATTPSRKLSDVP